MTGKTFALEDARVVTEFNSEYIVSSENTASGQIDVTFTNEGEVSTILAQYSLNIGNIDPSNVSVTYAGEEVSFTAQESSGMILKMSLGDILLEPDTPETVVVKYDVDPFFSEIGGAYDILLPIYDSASRSNGGTLVLKYPISFGAINYSSVLYSEEEGENTFTYTLTSDEKSATFISVGDRKDFAFSMERKLENTTNNYVTQEILLPIDSATQTIVFSNISPFPDGVNITDDGNLFITYNIAPDDMYWVRVQGVIITKSIENSTFTLSTNEKAVHLDKTMSLWKITDEDMLSDVEAVDSELTLSQKIDWIYAYLLENLNLSEDFRELHSFEQRKGAEIALETYKNASAEDFADSFVALARLMDIPSRIVCGYVFPYSTGGNQVGIYHVWAQYWSDELEWVSVDPAYELYSGYDQTRGTGINRVTIAVYPSSLSNVDFEETSSEIFPTGELVEEVTDLDIEIEIDSEIQAGLKTVGSVTLFNNGNTIIRNISFSDLGGDLEIAFGDPTDRSVLLPGESFDYSFRISISEWYTSGTKKIRVEVLSETASKEKRTTEEKTVKVIPLRWGEPVTWIITIVLFTISTWVLYVIYQFLLKKIPSVMSKFRKK
ncbi:MAG: transglutaminase-like domain-containing protein [bacterium]